MQPAEADFTILTPKRFNERFTLYLNAANEPVQRALREMTGGEVLQALHWLAAEVARREAEAKASGAAALADKLDAGEMIPDDLDPDWAGTAASQLRAWSLAQENLARLLHLVRINMPAWHRDQRMPLHEALRRYWRSA